MAEDTTTWGSPDRDKVNLTDESEVEDWIQELGVTEAELRAAVEVVGNRAEDVREYLASRPSTT